MEFNQIITLIETVSSSKLSHFDLEEGNLKISMKKEKKGNVKYVREEIPFEAAVVETEEAEEKPAQVTGSVIKSPLVGKFYSAPSPDEENFVKEGDVVKKGQVLGIVEAMKLMNEIESEFNGTVKKILVNNEDTVEYGQDLFIIEEK